MYPPFTISYEEAKTPLKNTATQEWQEGNEGYNFKNDSIHMLDRKGQTTLFHLRKGHCGLNKHLKKMGMAESAQCQCGAIEQTPVQILQTCPHFEEQTSSLTYRSSSQRVALGVWQQTIENNQFC